MANSFKIGKQITKKLSAADFIAVPKKGPKKRQNFFKSYFGHHKFFWGDFFFGFVLGID
jgi:hypothetical protein